MQKVLRRTALAKSQAKRKARIQSEKEHIRDVVNHRNAYQDIRGERHAAITREKVRRREDWELGPLSPWRNKMKALEVENFGTWSAQQTTMPQKPKKDRVKDWMIREGDRVCIVEGHPTVKGRIGKVKDVDKETNMMTVDGVQRIDVAIPEELREVYNQDSTIQTREAPIPYSHARLVYPLPDPSDDKLPPRDVIVDKLAAYNRHFDRFENEEVFERYIEPQHIRIPWPDKLETVYKDEEGDTLGIAVDDQTFTPTLRSFPFPNIVVNELRNPYSIFRTRHEEAYIEKKVQEDIEAEAEKLRTRSLLPRGARNLATVPNSSGRHRPKMSDQLAAAIGAHMAARTSTGRQDQST